MPSMNCKARTKINCVECVRRPKEGNTKDPKRLGFRVQGLGC